jgi:acyl-CoA hydrolase
MASRHTITFDSEDRCVDAVLSQVGKRIVLGLPVGIGKPNTLVNAFVERAVADCSIQLTIVTALSLRLPRWRSDLERRFLEPFVTRVFGGYVEPKYVRLLETDALPDNIAVHEFFLEPGAWLRNGHLQRNYLSANYTHVARDLIELGVNVIAQAVALAPNSDDTVSLSCNPDLTVDLLPYIRALRAKGKPFALIGQPHAELPYMYGDAVVSRDEFDMLVEPPSPSAPLFCPPNMPIGTIDYCIALNVSALIRDGGTLQLGIGELGDAIVYGLELRHKQPHDFAALLDALGVTGASGSLIETEGGRQPFARGVYGCTEMLVDGFLDLYRAGILKRCVYSHELLQRLLDDGRITDAVSIETLRALADEGLDRLSARDFAQLQLAGVFRDDARFRAGSIVLASGEALPAQLCDDANRSALAGACLGTRLRNGVLAHGGFFMGPKAFYKALRDMPDTERRQFAMQRIGFVNELYGDDQTLKVAQRRHARFVNTAMMVTGLGAAVSDALAEGQVVSGIGGQYNFVTMAHALPEARSILCVRSTRESQGRVTSNIVWNYAHTSIPRHLRDIVVTEYGIADLRGRPDEKIIEGLVNVMDARFQEEFVAQAKQHGKLHADYRIPDAARSNMPQKLENALRPYRQRGLFGATPFGTDFTDDELLIGKALRRLQAATRTRTGRAAVMIRALLAGSPNTSMQSLLARLELDAPVTLKQRIEQRAVANALREVQAKS